MPRWRGAVMWTGTRATSKPTWHGTSCEPTWRGRMRSSSPELPIPPAWVDQDRLSVTTDKGANASLKSTSLVPRNGRLRQGSGPLSGLGVQALGELGP